MNPTASEPRTQKFSTRRSSLLEPIHDEPDPNNRPIQRRRVPHTHNAVEHVSRPDGPSGQSSAKRAEIRRFFWAPQIDVALLGIDPDVVEAAPGPEAEPRVVPVEHGALQDDRFAAPSCHGCHGQVVAKASGSAESQHRDPDVQSDLRTVSTKNRKAQGKCRSGRIPGAEFAVSDRFKPLLHPLSDRIGRRAVSDGESHRSLLRPARVLGSEYHALGKGHRNRASAAERGYEYQRGDQPPTGPRSCHESRRYMHERNGVGMRDMQPHGPAVRSQFPLSSGCQLRS